MPTVEERLASLEGRVNEHSQTFAMMRDALGSLERHFDRFEERIDKRFDAVDRRFDAADRRFDIVDRRFDALESRFDVFQDRTLTWFGWLIALFITSTIAIISTILTR